MTIRSGRSAAPFGAGTEVAAAAIVLAYNAVINQVIPRAGYMVTNLAAAALAVAAGRSRGVSLEDMGLRRDRIGRGLRAGLIAAAVVAAGIAIVVAVPAGRHAFADQRAAGGATGHILFEALIRIPFGTALPEEIIFRGALLGLFLQRHSRRTATAITSVLFGVWHVLPTLDEPSYGAGRGASAVLVAVLATAGAGYVLAWLRFRADSVLAPILAHASLDSFALLAARLVAGPQT